MKFVLLSALLFVGVLATPEISPSFDAFRDVRFILNTLSNPNPLNGQFVNNSALLGASHFSSARSTRFIIHGFQSDASSDFSSRVQMEYIRAVSVNIIRVDWGIGANTIDYVTARNRVNAVGILIAQYIDMAARDHGLDLRTVTLVGHGLGAHIAGIAGKSVRNLRRINTIIGLDPSGPLFSLTAPNTRLARNDAFYVECIHTDNRNFGIGAPIGNVDFFVNGGSNQPGCLTSTCDHNRVVDLFVESIRSSRLWGRQCINMNDVQNPSCTGFGTRMSGEPSNAGRNLDGVFRFNTNSNAPFGQGEF
ncbi:unnamed protein product [Diamesa tonsa]